MTGPQDPAGGGRLRAGHADREQVIEALKDAFVDGRLTKDELDMRAGQALTARTRADLAALTAGIPPGLTTAKPPAPARAQGKAQVLRPGAVLTAATVLYAAMWPLALSIHRNIESNPVTFAHKLAVMSTLVYLLVAVATVVRMHNSRQVKRSGGQSPRRPAAGAGGRESQRLPSANPGGELPPVDGGQQHTAEAARSRLPGQQSSGSRPGRPRSFECAARMPRGTRPVPGTT
jgi:Domain of unknown function (DUF1707)